MTWLIIAKCRPSQGINIDKDTFYINLLRRTLILLPPIREIIISVSLLHRVPEWTMLSAMKIINFLLFCVSKDACANAESLNHYVIKVTNNAVIWCSSVQRLSSFRSFSIKHMTAFGLTHTFGGSLNNHSQFICLCACKIWHGIYSLACKLVWSHCRVYIECMRRWLGRESSILRINTFF